MIDRRTFLAGTGAVLLAAPLAAEAQQAAIRRVGIYSDAAHTGPLAPEWLEAFRGGLREHGWVEGRNVAIDFRESRTLEERPEAVALLLRTKPEVIVTNPVGAFVIRPSASQTLENIGPGVTFADDLGMIGEHQHLRRLKRRVFQKTRINHASMQGIARRDQHEHIRA